MAQLSLKKDYYKQLGVTKEDTKDTIRSAFLEQALIWHPDKAPDGKKEEYTQIYAQLQDAYKILTNDRAREQYDNALQKTAMELKGERDVTYKTSDKYKTDDGKFDKQAFSDDFNKSRSAVDQQTYSSLVDKYDKAAVVTDNEYQTMLKQRDLDLKCIDTSVQKIAFDMGGKFNQDVFNRAFDQMKKSNPTAVDEYMGDPQNMFSSTCLAECDDISGLHLNYGVSMTGGNLNDMISAVSLNPTDTMIDINRLDTGEKYGVEKPLTNAEMQQMVNNIMSDRTNLAQMKQSEFITGPSEMETMYPELFKPMQLEELETPVVDRKHVVITQADLGARRELPRPTKMTEPKSSVGPWVVKKKTPDSS